MCVCVCVCVCVCECVHVCVSVCVCSHTCVSVSVCVFSVAIEQTQYSTSKICVCVAAVTGYVAFHCWVLVGDGITDHYATKGPPIIPNTTHLSRCLCFSA